MDSSWDLIKAGRYEAACDAADEESLRYHSHRRLGNKVLALLAMKRFAEAASLCRHLIQLDGEMVADGHCLHLGVALWNQGCHDEAVSAWKESFAAPYTDAAGGVHVPLVLLYASIKLERHDLKAEMTSKLRNLIDCPVSADEVAHRSPLEMASIGNWPGSLALFMCGRMTEPELRSVANRVGLPEALRCRYHCQTAFFIGVDRLTRGDAIGFCKAMREACSEGGPALIEAEFYLARAEYENCAMKDPSGRAR